jgi:hypothetical protein
MSPQVRAILPIRAENPQRRDSVAERSEFELSVQLSELPDNSLMLSFATSRRCEALPPWTVFVARFRFVAEANGAKLDALSGRSSRGVLMSHEENALLERP